MGGEKFCEEVKEVLEELQSDKHLIKKVLDQADKHNESCAWRYKYKRGELQYEKIIKFKKVKNLIEYLLDLNDNNYA